MSGKFRHRLHGSKSRARIPKGMSSESNPSRSRHRSAASAARQAFVLQQGMVAVDDRPLVPDAVMDQLNLETMSLGKEPGSSSARSMVSEGGLSAISAFTSCTNQTFDAVHRVWKSGSSMQTEVVSVLAAVAELIKERGGGESDVEYMAALLVTLEGASHEDASRAAATAYLLHLVMRKVSKDVMQAQFTRIVNVIYTKIVEYATSPESSILKNLLAVLGVVLRAQPPAVWSNANTRQMVVSVCALCTHDRPWVRTMARRVSRAVLTDPVTAGDNGIHAAAAPVAAYILKELQGCLTAKNGVLAAIRYLCLLEGILYKMPEALFKQLAETILRSFSIADPTVKCSALQCMQRTLERQPPDAALPPSTCTLLLQSLRALAPPAADVTVLAHWMQALTEAQVCLSAKDASASAALLSETTACLARQFDGAGEPLAQLTYQLLTRIIECCVQDQEEAGKELLGLLHRSLHVQSAPVWRFVVRTQMRLFEAVGPGLVGEQFASTLKTLAELRESDTCMCKAELDFTVGSAVRHVGASAVLSVIGLKIDPEAAVLPLDLPRSWLIPVLRVNLHKAPLSLFLKYFLPLAIKLHRRLASFETSSARVYTAVQLQLWELLPAFLESPTEFESTFPTLAPILGTAIQERKDLRTVVMSGLRAALRFVQQPDAPVERVEAMMRFAKNFQPILFNLYTNGSDDNEDYDERGMRMSALETIRMYADTTPHDLVAKYVSSGMTKAAETAEASQQARILDVVAALLRNADVETCRSVMQVVLPWLGDKSSPPRQKKAYRILEELLRKVGTPEFDAVFIEHAQEIEQAVCLPISNLVPQARAAQTASARLLLPSMTDTASLNNFTEKLMPNIVQMLDKGNSVAARANASKCLQELCGRLVEAGSESGLSTSTVLSGVLGSLFGAVAPAVEGPVKNGGKKTKKQEPAKASSLPGAADENGVPLHIARGSLVALNIVAQKHIRNMAASDTARLVAHSCTWLSDVRPQVRVLALRLLRVLLQKLGEFGIQQYREIVLSSVFSQEPKDGTIKVRKATRLLLEVLIDRLGGPIVAKATDREEWHNLLRSIEKQRRRKERKQSGEQAAKGDDSDNDAMSVGGGSRTSARTAGADTILALLDDSDEEKDEDDEAEERMEKRSRTGNSVWLRQDDEGAPMDLLDRKNLIGKVSTMDPRIEERRKARVEKRREENGGFTLSKSGKLIIDLGEEEKTRRRKAKREEEDGEEEGEETDDEEDEDERGPKKRRRVEKDSDDETSRVSGYRPGGKGIHRALSTVSGVSSAAISRGGGGRGKGHQKGAAEAGRKGRGGQPLQPYAYVPLKQLRKNGGKKQLKPLLGRKRKAAGSRTSTVGSKV